MGSSNTGITDSSASASASASESDGSSSETASDPQTQTQTQTQTQNQNDADSCPFSVAEKVLASHNGSFYEAKVLQIMGYLNRWEFLVHYHGWSKNWDEWVDSDRLMAYTEENAQKHLTAKKKKEIDKSIELPRSSNLKPGSTNVLVRGKKRKNDDNLSSENIHVTKGKYAKIRIPPRLKKHLVDDCEFVTHMGKLVKLPRTPNVKDIFNKYLQNREKKDDSLSDSVHEVMQGLQSYFDRALPMMLLYKNERRQYEKEIADDVPPSNVYGAEHLLRLFVKLPELMFHANIEEETFIELMQKINDFLKYFRTNQRAFFRSAYYVADRNASKGDESDDRVQICS